MKKNDKFCKLWGGCTYIILVGLTMTWYSEKMLISNICRRGLMPNLFKKSWTVSMLEVWSSRKIYRWGNKSLLWLVPDGRNVQLSWKPRKENPRVIPSSGPKSWYISRAASYFIETCNLGLVCYWKARHFGIHEYLVLFWIALSLDQSNRQNWCCKHIVLFHELSIFWYFNCAGPNVFVVYCTKGGFRGNK